MPRKKILDVGRDGAIHLICLSTDFCGDLRKLRSCGARAPAGRLRYQSKKAADIVPRARGHAPHRRVRWRRRGACRASFPLLEPRAIRLLPPLRFFSLPIFEFLLHRRPTRTAVAEHQLGRSGARRSRNRPLSATSIARGARIARVTVVDAHRHAGPGSPTRILLHTNPTKARGTGFQDACEGSLLKSGASVSSLSLRALTFGRGPHIGGHP
jgi:hypothetical protein